jgi:hypothetical protein
VGVGRLTGEVFGVCRVDDNMRHQHAYQSIFRLRTGGVVKRLNGFSVVLCSSDGELSTGSRRRAQTETRLSLIIKDEVNIKILHRYGHVSFNLDFGNSYERFPCKPTSFKRGVHRRFRSRVIVHSISTNMNPKANRKSKKSKSSLQKTE